METARVSTSRPHGVRFTILTLAVAIAGVVGAPRADEPAAFPREDPFVIRKLVFEHDGRWYGEAVCYGPHRDGQRPGGPDPDRDELREDLDLIASHWRMLRLYGSRGPARDILELIRERGLDLEVMLGVWISVEETRTGNGDVQERHPGMVEANRAEIETALELAAAFPGIVTSLCVGNETQVFWSDHRSPVDILIRYLREVRARSPLPVTTADDYNFWNKRESRDVAREVDFINVYAHPLWNGIRLERALEWTRTTLRGIAAVHPGRPVVLGETGWATRVHDQGEQATLIKGATGEAEQAVYFEQIRDWSRRTHTPVFWFEAFDETWKGGDHPDEVEKHWGVFNADRTPKQAVRDER